MPEIEVGSRVVYLIGTRHEDHGVVVELFKPLGWYPDAGTNEAKTWWVQWEGTGERQFACESELTLEVPTIPSVLEKLVPYVTAEDADLSVTELAQLILDRATEDDSGVVVDITA